MGRIYNFFHKADVYSVAIRKKDDEKGLLFEGNYSPFSVLPISKKNWYADPIIFSYKDKEYLFMEVYDRVTDIGHLGVCEIIENKLTRPEIVLNIGTHLSYPCVFEVDGSVYMVPETTTLKNVQLYKAKNFPYEWEQVGVLLKDNEFADSTVYIGNNLKLMLTFEHCNGNGSITKTHVFNAEKITDCKLDVYPSEEYDFNDYSRGGGKLFHFGSQIVRPTQDCSKEYGYALNFMAVDLSNNFYSEKKIASVFPENLTFIDFNKKVKGVHTYAICDNYEIIDVKFDDPRISYQIRRIWRFFIRKVKGIFKRG